MPLAIFDTASGHLQHISDADTIAKAVRSYAATAGIDPDVDLEVRVIDVTDEQACSLMEWHERGAKTADYPQGLDSGTVYDPEEVRSLIRAAA